jgi:hypothetical protein
MVLWIYGNMCDESKNRRRSWKISRYGSRVDSTLIAVSL